MSDMTLYQRTDALLALDALIADNDGEVTPEQEAELAALTGSIADKAEAVAAKRAECLATADACIDEAARLSKRAKTLQARAQWLERYLLAELAKVGMQKVTGQRFTISRTLNPPKAVPLIDAPTMRADLAALPDPIRECVRVTPAQAESYAWDRAALAKLAKTSPDALEGVAIIERTERVTIS
jgi:hypothetical protein